MHAKATPGGRAAIALLLAALSLTAAATAWLGWRAYGPCRGAQAAAGADGVRALLGLGMTGLALPLLVGAWAAMVRATRAGQAALAAARGDAEGKLLRLALVAEQAGEGIALAGLDGRLQFVNAAWAHMHGYGTGEELIGRHLSIFHSEEQMRHEVIPFNEEVVRRGQFTREMGHVRKDGTPFIMNMTVALLKDAEGEPIGFAALAADVTERRRVEEALRASEEKFRTLVERIPAVVYAISLDGSPVAGYASPRAEAMLGLPVADVDRWAHQLHPEDRERVLAEVASCHATGEPLVTEYRFVRPDGRVVWLHDEGAMVCGPAGRRTLHLGVLLDVTERKQASEKLGRTLAELELFNRLAVGRELRMVELKREVNDMARAAGRRPPYDLSSLQPGAAPDTLRDTAGGSPAAPAFAREAQP